MNLLYLLLLLLVGFVIWAAIRWYRTGERETDPIKLRIRQAAKLKWKQTAEIAEDGKGAAWTRRSVRFVSGERRSRPLAQRRDRYSCEIVRAARLRRLHRIGRIYSQTSERGGPRRRNGRAEISARNRVVRYSARLSRRPTAHSGDRLRFSRCLCQILQSRIRGRSGQCCSRCTPPRCRQNLGQRPRPRTFTALAHQYDGRLQPRLV